MSKPATITSSSTAPECLSQSIVEEIADLEGTRPTELRPTLHSVIDPEALDALVHSMSTPEPDSQGLVGFTYCGYDVRVHSDGEIAITEA